MDAFLVVFMRSVHILSAITLLGGAICWRFAMSPAAIPLSAETRDKVSNAVAAAWKPFLLTSVLGLLISGSYNFYRKISAGVPKEYHMVIGIKFLLVLHVFAVGLLLTKQQNARRDRQLTGVIASGVVIVILSAVLRYLTSK